LFHLTGFQGKEKRVTEKVLLTAFEVFKEPGARVIQTPRWILCKAHPACVVMYSIHYKNGVTDFCVVVFAVVFIVVNYRFCALEFL